ncbi:MAG: bifunctional phosphopantothenoylcysteine decarboxylase/phosphopantothenate--cysteine ligase CoaBC [Saprospiraceae bacterium]
MDLKGKKIILGVCGSIAAYKALILVRLMTKAGMEVRVIMTRDAEQFVGKLSFSSLTGQTVHSDLTYASEWNNHVELGLWADLLVIAPATAQTISKMAHGMVDNLLTAVYLSAKCPVMVAPAMDLDMWAHQATQHNIGTLRNYGNQIIPVSTGPLASGLSGAGRLAEPEDIFRTVCQFFTAKSDLAGKSVLVTAGPTYEPIDPVRFIGNYSSGKMGVRIAEEVLRRGGQVFLILGPASILPPVNPALTTVKVQSATEMLEAVKRYQESSDFFILAAAVADFMPEKVATEKIKKNVGVPEIRLVQTPDIAAHLGTFKKGNQRLVGFALETENILDNARSKMNKKNMDMIVINSPREAGAGFGGETNRIDILKKNGEVLSFELKSKSEVAEDIVNEMIKL